MKFQISKKLQAQRGSILIICMVLAGLGTIGVAAWATLLDARTHQAEQTQTALDRRVQFSNSVALAREIIYQKYLHADRGPTTIEEFTINGDVGRVTIGDWDEPVMGFSDATRINKTGAVPFRAFSLDIDVGIDDGSFVHDFTFQLKSYSPVLGGDLLHMHKNVETGNEKLEATGDLRVEGRAVFWNADYKTSNMTSRTDAALAAGDSVPNLSFLDTDDSAILPSNFPFVTQTSGAVDGDYDLSGKLNVVNNPDTPSNSYVSKIVSYGVDAFAGLEAPTGATGSGAGIDSNPDSGDDGAVGTLINSGSYTLDNLIPYAPLSSAMLKGVLADDTLTAAEKEALLMASQPIPDDVIGDVVQSPVLLDSAQTTILNGADFHAFIQDGKATVNLNSATLPHLILRNITDIQFIGQPDDASADALIDNEPRIIVVNNDSGVDLETINFLDMNRRRIIFAVHNENYGNASSAAVTFTGAAAFPDWHMLLDFESVRTKWDTSAVGGVRIYGGIRTDQLVNVKSGTVVLRKETNVDVLETMASRAAWIETIRK